MKTLPAAIAALFLLVPMMAQAQDRQAARAACGADMQRLCKGVMPGGGRILVCLRKHDADLSPACRTFVQSQPPAK